MEQECLLLYDDGLEFLYHDTTSKFTENMDVYRIPKENINAVIYDREFHIVTIIGEGELLSYDDFESKRLNHQNSERRFYENSPYSFISTFDEEDVVVNKIRSMAKYKEL